MAGDDNDAVLLGVCDDPLTPEDEKSNNWWLNKVGGKPVCLKQMLHEVCDRRNRSGSTHSLMTIGLTQPQSWIGAAAWKDSLVCGVCAQDLVFIMQIHAPSDEVDQRVIYIFACREVACTNTVWIWNVSP
jgi:hypothetical protein